MLSLLKSKIALAVGIALLLTSASAAAMTKLYLDKRDDLAQQEVATQLAEARTTSAMNALQEQRERTEALEALRIALNSEINALENQEVETITEIQTVWRDREVIVNNPVAVECAVEPVPAGVLRLLCQSDSRGACGNLQPST